MNYNKAILGIALACTMMASCDKPKSFPCEITIYRSADAGFDSISVYCYESDYMRSREVFLGKLNADTTRISENCNLKESRVGFFKLDNDSIAHYFVIEPGKLMVKLYKDNIILEGSASNRKLIMFRHKVNAILQAKDKIRDEYQKSISDSTLTAANEREWYVSDSILSDSLQKSLVEFMVINDAAAKIAREQYAPLLRESSWSEIEQSQKQ